MSGATSLLTAMADELFSRTCTREVIDQSSQGRWPKEVWRALEDNGLPAGLAPQELGGAGLTMADAMAVLRIAGQYAVPGSLSESLIAGALLAEAGLPLPGGACTLSCTGPWNSLIVTRRDSDWLLSGTVSAVSWARSGPTIVLFAAGPDADHAVTVRPSQISSAMETSDARLSMVTGQNLAGEPRDTISFSELPLDAASVSRPAPRLIERLQVLGALARAAMMAGALERVLDLTVQHAHDRIQFGRPIAKFQAIQQNLAILAGETAAAVVSAGAAASAADNTDILDASFEIACAKCRTGLASRKATALAHQIHGAIGFTQEHALHLWTRRLWSWRDEFGSETEWAKKAGELAMTAGPEGLWPLLSGVTA